MPEDEGFTDPLEHLLPHGLTCAVLPTGSRTATRLRSWSLGARHQNATLGPLDQLYSPSRVVSDDVSQDSADSPV